MADHWSVEMLVKFFATTTFAYKWLAQGLSKSLWALLSFLHEYLDPDIEADHWAFYADDLRVAVQRAQTLPGAFGKPSSAFKKDWNLEQKSGIVESIQFISQAKPLHLWEFHRKLGEFKTFSAKSASPKQKRPLQRYLGFTNCYRLNLSGRPKSVINSINCSNLNYLPEPHQNWKKHLSL